VAVIVSDYYALSKGDNIQAYIIYSVFYYYKDEIDNIFLKQFIAPVKKLLKINESKYVCHMLAD
jgi:hypothetical protein